AAMSVVDQTDVTGDHVFADSNSACDIHIALDLDAGRGLQDETAACGHDDRQLFATHVVADPCTVGIGGAVEVGVIAGAGELVTIDADQDKAGGHLTAGAEYQALLAQGRGAVPADRSGAIDKISQPTGENVAGFHPASSP